MSRLRLGIVGSGMIAGVIARAASQAANIEITAVASRRVETARAFAETHGIAQVFHSWQAMLASDQIDAVYVATPTAVKEEVALFGARQGKHLLVDKPFASADSVTRIVDAANANNVSFMDATHFTHHARTHAIKQALSEHIGAPQAVKTAFFFPFMDRTNIRFNPEKEPTGAVGDMAWYSMRAIAEYLQPTTPVATIAGSIQRDAETRSVIRGAGLVVFSDGKSSTFNFGYNAGTCLMDLDIIGESAVLSLDDYVLDWKNGFAFDQPQHRVGYTRRTGMQPPAEHEFIVADTDEPQATAMLRHFAELSQQPGDAHNRQAQQLTLMTQQLVDAYWHAVA